MPWTTSRATRTSRSERLEPVLAHSRGRPHPSPRARQDRAGRPGTRSSTTCSRPRCSPGAPGTRPNVRWSGSARPRGDVTGAWRCGRRGRARRPRGDDGARPLGAVAAADAREKALAAEAGDARCEGAPAQANAARARARPRARARCSREAAQPVAPSASTEDVLRRALRESRSATVAQLGVPVDAISLPARGHARGRHSRTGRVRLVDGRTPGRVVSRRSVARRRWLAGRTALTVRGPDG